MTAPDAQRQRVPLAEQAEVVHRLLHACHRSCEARVKAGEMTREAADREISGTRAARDTLRLFARHEDAVRATVQHEMHCDRLKAEADSLRDDPAVAAVMDAFPQAEVADVRTIEETAAA